MSEQSFVEYSGKQLKKAGIQNAEFVRARFEAKNFGNAEAVFRIRLIVLRFVRHRGQEFLDLASGSDPEEFHRFCDVEIAMGWKTIEAVAATSEPEDIGNLLGRLRAHQDALNEAFSGDREPITRTRIESAERDRGEALLRRRRSLFGVSPHEE